MPLPYMRQLPQDFYTKNLPGPVSVVAAPVTPEPPYQFPIPELGEEVSFGGGGVEEAPTDGQHYARRLANWTSDWDGGSY